MEFDSPQDAVKTSKIIKQMNNDGQLVHSDDSNEAKKYNISYVYPTHLLPAKQSNYELGNWLKKNGQIRQYNISLSWKGPGLSVLGIDRRDNEEKWFSINRDFPKATDFSQLQFHYNINPEDYKVFTAQMFSDKIYA